MQQPIKNRTSWVDNIKRNEEEYKEDDEEITVDIHTNLLKEKSNEYSCKKDGLKNFLMYKNTVPFNN